MPQPRLDVTLANASLLDSVTAEWVIHAARDPKSVSARIMCEGNAGVVVELTYVDGNGHGGLVFRAPGGAISCLAAIERSDPLVVKQRTDSLMASALALAKAHHVYAQHCVKTVSVLVFGVIPVVTLVAIALAMAFWQR